MGQQPKTILTQPPKADTLPKSTCVRFQRGSQAASATAMVVLSDDPEEEMANRREAERVAREAAENKYVSEFQEPIDWPSANVLVTHTSLDVICYINVEV